MKNKIAAHPDPVDLACRMRRQEATSEPAVEAATPTPAPTMPARTASAVEATVFFVSPADGETVSNPVSIVFGIEGMTVAPAGQDVPSLRTPPPPHRHGRS